jgi:hypothetical protein
MSAEQTPAFFADYAHRVLMACGLNSISLCFFTNEPLSQNKETDHFSKK